MSNGRRDEDRVGVSTGLALALGGHGPAAGGGPDGGHGVCGPGVAQEGGDNGVGCCHGGWGGAPAGTPASSIISNPHVPHQRAWGPTGPLHRGHMRHCGCPQRLQAAAVRARDCPQAAHVVSIVRAPSTRCRARLAV